MNGMIPVNDDKIPTVNQIYDRVLRKRFPGNSFTIQRHMIMACCEEFHNMLMEQWRGKMTVLDVTPQVAETINTALSKLQECPGCFNRSYDPDSKKCFECHYSQI